MGHVDTCVTSTLLAPGGAGGGGIIGNPAGPPNSPAFSMRERQGDRNRDR